MQTRLLLLLIFVSGMFSCEEAEISPNLEADNNMSVFKETAISAFKPAGIFTDFTTIKYRLKPSVRKRQERIRAAYKQRLQSSEVRTETVSSVEITATSDGFGELYTARWNNLENYDKKVLIQDVDITDKFDFASQPIIYHTVSYFNAENKLIYQERAPVVAFADGRTALQAPTIEQLLIEEGEKGTKLIAVVANDPAEQVGKIEVVLKDIISGPTPNSDLFSLERGVYEGNWNSHDWQAVWLEDSKGELGVYEVKISAFTKDGKQLFHSENVNLGIQQRVYADFTGRVKRVRIKKRRTGSYNIIVFTEGNENAEATPEKARVRLVENGDLDFDADGDFDARLVKDKGEGIYKYVGKFSMDLKLNTPYRGEVEFGIENPPSTIFPISWASMLD